MDTGLFDSAYLRSEMFYGWSPSEELVSFIHSKPAFTGRALDLGCGDGRDSIFLARKGFVVTAIDISQVAITKLGGVAEKECLPITCLRLDVKDFDFEPETYDLVVSTTLLDHLESETRDYVIRGIKRSLKIGGYTFIEVFTVEDPGYVISNVSKPEQDAQSGLSPSECASEIRYYYGKDELLSQFNDLDTILYIEKTEPDSHHGAFHFHGVARLIAQKAR